MMVWIVSLLITTSWSATPAPTMQPLYCSCSPNKDNKGCGVNPAFMNQNEIEISRQLGFDVPSDDEHPSSNLKGHALYQALAKFLEKSDRARLFYPEYYTRATKDVAVLTLNSKFQPKNPTETEEYFRCSIPKDKYCIFKQKLRPYIGLAAKSSGIDFSFLACQAYVESRFKNDAKSSVGAMGYSQIQPSNIDYMNTILRRSINNSANRIIASASSPREEKMNRAQREIANIWREFWKGTRNAPHKLCTNDLTCYRQAFLAQALSLKTDMLAFTTSSSGLKVEFDEQGDFKIEGMDKGDSLLLLAGSYNVGVTKMMRLISKHCSGSRKLKECLEQMNTETVNKKDVQAITNYVMRIRDCSQQFSAEQLDFNDDERWTEEMRTEKQNKQRDNVAQCLLNPCPYQQAHSNEKDKSVQPSSASARR